MLAKDQATGFEYYWDRDSKSAYAKRPGAINNEQIGFNVNSPEEFTRIIGAYSMGYRAASRHAVQKLGVKHYHMLAELGRVGAT